MHLHNEIILSRKKGGSMKFCDSVSGPGKYAQWNKPVRERQMPYDLTHMWSLWTRSINKQSKDRHREQDDSY